MLLGRLSDFQSSAVPDAQRGGNSAQAIGRLVAALGRIDSQMQAALPAVWLEKRRDFTTVSTLGTTRRQPDGARPFFVTQPFQLM